MVWGRWMVPQLEEQEDLDLRRGELGLLEQVHRHPEEVARYAGQLLRQNAMNHRIVQQAAARILELEAREAAIECGGGHGGRSAGRGDSGSEGLECVGLRSEPEYKVTVETTGPGA